MLDINNYNDESVFTSVIEDIENDIYYDINDVLRNNRLYFRDRFKNRSRSIDIVYPRYSFSEFRAQYKGPDSIRFQLSLYPVKEDLEKVRHIILRPRHIELDNAELVSLYICKEKTIVLYLHYPCNYLVGKSIAGKFSCLFDNHMPVSSDLGSKLIGIDENSRSIPPLWYILSMISCNNDDKIEKFLVKRSVNSSRAFLGRLSELSFQYSRLGY